MKTSIDFLLNELLQNKLLALRYDQDGIMDEIVAKAKEIHKEEVIEAFKRGTINEMNGIEEINSEQYYQETFKKD
jgi:predicted flavoprotein YhiN